MNGYVSIKVKKIYRKKNPGMRYGRKNWTEKHIKQWKVNIKVFQAIRKGKLIKEPCVDCGVEEKIHAHHEDYSKPLDVVWVCAAHHKKYH